MKLQEDLQKEEKILERTKQEQEKFFGKVQAELDQERGLQNRPDVIERIEGRLTATQKAYSDLIGKSEQRISSLRAEISQAETQMQEQARADLQGTKEKMRAAWLAAGIRRRRLRLLPDVADERRKAPPQTRSLFRHRSTCTSRH